MQREIKKKTITYGIAAVLLVTILAGSIYNFGTLFSPTQPLFSELKTFSSFEELENFITTNMETVNQNSYALNTLKNSRTESLGAQDAATQAPMEATIANSAGELSDYSGTNIQVQGVDEADTVKTDGEYIYIVSGNTLTILKAYPPQEAKVVSKITVEGYITGVFINENKLVIFETEYNVFPYYGIDSPAILENQDVIEVKPKDAESTNATEPSNQTKPSKEPEQPIDDDIKPVEPFIPIIRYEPPTTNIKVYDVSNRQNPVLARTVTLNGTLSGSRMIGDYVYIVNNEFATPPNYDNEKGFDIVLPVIAGDDVIKVDASKIHYIDVADEMYYITTIIAIDTQNDAAKPTYEAFLTSSTTNMYVSLDNMYLVAPDTTNWLLMSSDEQPKQETLIYRVKLDKQNIAVEAEGSVPGFVLNQFSMDEHNGYFRIATTEWTNSWTQETFTSESTNNLFVLDMNLNLAGKLENIAPDESIYSVRFMGDKVYMVTFKQVDPFFVIDTSNPTQPTILGYLKIPGYSSYLHPYDETHIIGVGMENSTLKLSLFDVTDFTAPKEIAKYTVEGSWSSSNALWDHKAFLFDKSKNLLALPVTVSTYTERLIDRDLNTDDIPKETNGSMVGDEEIRKEAEAIEEREAIAIQSSYYQGAYIFDISLENGFVLKGDITHPSNNEYEQNAYINRIIYIEDALYTISDQLVKINNLESLEQITQIQIS
ncbi:MAG: beta-propeller domain-containing protein [Candidatus Bathyarchaeota archaeon]|nr:beta-propeller domain-containing protein [Candidatus Bathyarchaeum tardum]